jgi:mannitol/fructose-specific phosphotransferase system IIA component (Ntr-type)
MNLLRSIEPAALLPRLAGADQIQVCTRLVERLTAAGGVSDQERLLADLLARERSASTVIGQGLAVPHTRSTAVERLRIAVATLSDPLDLGAEDGRPIDVFFLIVAPAASARLLLLAMARLARLVKRGQLLADLRRARTAKDMLAAILAAEENGS